MSSCELVVDVMGMTIPPCSTFVVVMTVVVNWYPILRRNAPAEIAK